MWASTGYLFEGGLVQALRPLVCLVLALYLGVDAGYGQDGGFRLPYNHYTTRDGLVQLQIRSLASDAYGQIWIGTQNGLSMFDGKNFRTYGPAQGVPRSVLVQLAVDEHQRVWALSYSELCVFDGIKGKVFPLPGPPQNGEFVILPDGKLLVRHGHLTLFADSVFQELPHPLPEAILRSDNLLYMDAAAGEMGTLDNETRTFLLFNLKGEVRPLFTLRPDEHVYTSKLINTPIQFTIVGPEKDRHLTLVDRDTVTVLEVEDIPSSFGEKRLRFKMLRPELCPAFLFIPSDRGKGLWIRGKDGYQRWDDLQASAIFAINLTTTGQVYIGTSKGLLQYHLNGWTNLEVPFCDLPWSVIPLADHDEVVLGCHREGILSMTRAGVLSGRHGFGKKQLDQNDQVFPGYCLMEDGGQLFGGFRGVYRKMPAGGVRHMAEPFTIEAIYADTVRAVLLAAGIELLTFDLDGRPIRRDPIPEVLSQKVSCTDILVDREGRQWLSCWGGVGRRTTSTSEWELFLLSEGRMPFESVFSMLEDRQGRLWCGGSEGLAVWRSSSDAFQAVFPKLITDQVSQVLLTGDTLLVIGSKDFFLLEISGPAPRLLAHLDVHRGYQVLEPSENGAFLEASGVLWVAAASGIHQFDLAHFGTHALGLPNLLLDWLNEKAVPQSEKTRARVHIRDRKLVIRYRIIGPLSEKVQLQYRIDSDGIWTKSGEEGIILVENLRHGVSTVYIRAVLPGWPEADWPNAEVYVHCQLPFFDRKEVQTAAFVLLGFLLVWGLWSLWEHVRNKRKLAKLHKEVDESRLQAIQAQLNPHFIFNAMTSLQNTIQNKTPEEASRQLVRLSRIIRQVLEFSVKQTDAKATLPLTLLEEELNLLRQYVELEQQQRDPGFYFHLDIEPDLLVKNPLVPPLLIQPFVENAIIHGLAPLDYPGNIWVRITAKDDKLHYTIEDDGIGRKAAQEVQSGSSFVHRSLGVTLLQERIRTLQALGYACQLEINDRTPNGTFVHLQLSPHYENRNY